MHSHLIHWLLQCCWFAYMLFSTRRCVKEAKQREIERKRERKREKVEEREWESENYTDSDKRIGKMHQLIQWSGFVFMMQNTSGKILRTILRCTVVNDKNTPAVAGDFFFLPGFFLPEFKFSTRFIYGLLSGAHGGKHDRAFVLYACTLSDDMFINAPYHSQPAFLKAPNISVHTYIFFSFSPVKRIYACILKHCINCRAFHFFNSFASRVETDLIIYVRGITHDVYFNCFYSKILDCALLFLIPFRALRVCMHRCLQLANKA